MLYLSFYTKSSLKLRIYFLPSGVGCEGNQGLTLTDCSPFLTGCLRHQSSRMACGHPITQSMSAEEKGQNLPIQAKSSKIKQLYTSKRTFFNTKLISNSPICALDYPNVRLGHLIIINWSKVVISVQKLKKNRKFRKNCPTLELNYSKFLLIKWV